MQSQNTAKDTAKKLTQLTDEDALAVINTVHLLTENSLEGRHGILGLGFEDSLRKYGEAYIEFKHVTVDRFDGSNYCEWKSQIKFYHGHIWLEEFTGDGEPSCYNKNHFYGYKKLQELGYAFPERPSL